MKNINETYNDSYNAKVKDVREKFVIRPIFDICNESEFLQ